MSTARTMSIAPSQSCRTLLIIILFTLSLVSCSFNFDMPWDNKKVPEVAQKKVTKPETAQEQAGDQSPPMLSSSVCEGGRKWTKYSTDEDDVKHFYDEDAVTRPSGNIVQIWRKREFSSGAAQRQIVTLEEIDCRRAEYRTLELCVAYWDGTTGRSEKPTGWVKIYENSHESYFMSEYCK
ncbi:MAG TPA: surface-adhesin E family protein [Syntrophorhabdales bacterium]|nr:surface-adhesin E family protein [Syntrophorhabdales bacterium]